MGASLARSLYDPNKYCVRRDSLLYTNTFYGAIPGMIPNDLQAPKPRCWYDTMHAVTWDQARQQVQALRNTPLPYTCRCPSREGKAVVS